MSYWYVFCDWRPIASLPSLVNLEASETTFRKSKKVYQKNQTITFDVKPVKIFNGSFEYTIPGIRGNQLTAHFKVDNIYFLNNGFFLFTIQSPRQIRDDETAVELGKFYAHAIKEDVLMHKHSFHTEDYPYSYTSVLLQGGTHISTKRKAENFIKRSIKDSASLKNLIAQKINKKSSASKFKALELMKMIMSEKVEKDYLLYEEQQKKSFLHRKRSSLITVSAVIVGLLITFYAFFAVFNENFSAGKIQISILIVLYITVFSMLIFRSYANTNLVKLLIKFKGFADRSQALSNLISSYFDPYGRIPNSRISAGLSQLTEYEKEKGLKYKMHVILFVSYVALMIASARLFFNV